MQAHDTVDTATPRYGFDPKVAFATTLAGAERRRQAAAAAANGRPVSRSRRLISWLAAGMSVSPPWSPWGTGAPRR